MQDVAVPGGHVQRVELGVTVDGTAVEASAVRVDRSMMDPVAGTGMSSASAEVHVSARGVVESTTPTPWSAIPGWPPRGGSRVDVSVGAGAGMVPVLTGARAIRPSGATGERGVTVQAEDSYAALQRPLSWNASEWRPDSPAPTSGAWHEVSTVDRMLREAGFCQTPPTLPQTVLSVPGVGSVRPDVGTMTAHSAPTGYWYDSGGFPFLCAGDATGTYTLTQATTSYLSIAFMAYRRVGAASRSIIVSGGAGPAITILVGATYVRVLWGGSGASSTMVDLAAPGADPLVRLSFAPQGAGSRVMVETSVGSTVWDAAATGISGKTAVVATFGDARMCGLVVDRWTTAATARAARDGWTPTAEIHLRATNQVQWSPPAVVGRSVAEMLREQAAALAAVFWIDERGVMQWWELAMLEARPPAMTLTSADHLSVEGFSWTLEDAQASRVDMRVIYQTPTRSGAGTLASTAWTGDQEIPPGTSTFWIECPSEESWAGVSLVLQNPRLATDVAALNSGSWAGASRRDANGVAQWATDVTFSITRINDNTFTVTVNNGGAAAQMQLPDAAATGMENLKRAAGRPGFVLRAALVEKLVPVTFSSEDGPDQDAPVRTVEAGWWSDTTPQGNPAVMTQRVLDYYAGRLLSPMPVLSDIEIVPQPGLQLGDVVVISDSHVTNSMIRGLIVGDVREYSTESVSHRIAVRVLSADLGTAHWEDWGATMAGRQWQTWGAGMAGRQWQSWAADPLGGED